MNSLGVIYSAINVLHFMITAFALLVCWQFRRISPTMNLVVAGLAAMLLSAMWYFARPLITDSDTDSWKAAAMIALPGLIGVGAWGLFVIGLAAMFLDIRGRITPAKDFHHDLE